MSATVGAHLRRWRTRRGQSQMRVASGCAVSTRHLSFIETGRARPSKALIVRLARFLDVTNHELNTCLLSAGHAPVHIGDLDTTPDALDTTPRETIDRHEPHPAFVFNASWVMERLNRGGQWLCSTLMPRIWATIDDPHRGIDMIATLAHPDGLLSSMRDAPHVGAALLRQLRIEQLTNPDLGARLDDFERSLHHRYPDHDLAETPERAEPALHLDFDTCHGVLSFFTMQAVVGIPQMITVGTPRVELWFPAEAHTRAVLHAHVEPAP